MNRHDLRIGNKLLYDQKIATVVGISVTIKVIVDDIIGILHLDFSQLSEIKLTDDILINNLKFTKSDDGFGGLLSPINEQGGRLRIINNTWNSGIFIVKLDYLHELQNLWYALFKTKLIYER